MNIDPQLNAYYSQVSAAFPPIADADALTRRTRNKQVAERFAPPAPRGVHIDAIDVPLEGRTLRARLYRPSHLDDALPLVVYYHGGGWVLGDLDTHEQVAVGLALDAGVAVASIDYRLAPEHPFPAANDDALDALFWFAEQRPRFGLSVRPIGVAGDSAGAFLATYAARQANEIVPGLVKAQLLLYPVVHPGIDTPSYERFTNGPGLTRGEMLWFWTTFLDAPVMADGAGERWMADPRVNLVASIPEHAPADAIVMVAGVDPLRDEGVDYARFLEQHGGDVELIEAKDMTHGFARLQHMSNAARDWMRQAGVALREML
ncbi:alpha/beta hydrolase [Pararobbsia silviterrae]|uniref:Alpha/beta hydrolase n=1 Tax=Pararobbsia silviterrae TaxID=1792498 RepID=A0A494YAB2_9BURK|nr:alpha/beta hydrolase [Pararobbsia silviterrae]RKP59336.1 alpha/beta hydrolase [Pararobbsia silviterrae]